MCLTATATPAVEEDIELLFRNPVVQKMSMNRPNFTLNVEELKEVEPIQTVCKKGR